MPTVAVVWEPEADALAALATAGAVVRPAVADQGPYARGTPFDALVTRWHGQRWATLPGGVRAMLQCGRLTFAVTARQDRRDERPGPDEAEVMVGRE